MDTTRTYRRDSGGKLRPALGVPEKILRRISLQQQITRGQRADSSQNHASPDVLDVPVTTIGRSSR